MSKRMSKFLMSWIMLVMLQIYGLAIYQYGQTYGFNEEINPLTIIAATLMIIGFLALIGRYLNKKEMQGEVKDQKNREDDHEADDDTKR